MNISKTSPSISAAKPKAAAAAPAAENSESPEAPVRDRLEISLPTFEIDAAKIGKLAYKGVRAIPGTLSLALNAPVVTVAPLLNAVSPATTNKEAIFKERWANVLGTTAIGTAAGAIIGGSLGNAWAGAGLGAIGGLGTGGLRSLLTPLWTPTVGHSYYTKHEAAKYPEIGNEAHSASYGSKSKSHAVGARLRAGYAAAFREAYEDGGKAVDSFSTGSVNFFKGLTGRPD